ncbi:unnamed protein product [Lymnaea stagnalis]|uniref:Dynein regulatory complex protein 10 n=1 Tax=Lymnaea stagnalis TaxID=6523 RepID=A0AAV2H2N9_LYMST
MNDKMDEFQRLEITYEDERKLLSEMEDRFAELEAEYNNLMQERLVARRRQEWAERDKKALIKYITVIQSFWRGYTVRKNIKKDEKRRIKEEKRKEKELKEQERKAKLAAGKE